MKKKVLHIIHGFSIGGAEKIVLKYLYDFRNDPDIDIYALTLSPSSNSIFDRKISYDNLNVIYGNIKFVGPNSSIWAKLHINLKAIKMIHETLKQIKPDIVHTHLAIQHLSLLPTLLRRVKKKYHTIHSIPGSNPKRRFKYIDKIAFKYCHVVPVCLTNHMIKLTKQYYNISHCELVRNGIDTGIFKKYYNTSAIRKELGISSKSFVVGHVGRLCKTKNQKFIIDVFAKIKDKIPDATLLLIGEGEDKAEIVKKVRSLSLGSSVRLLGARADIPKLLSIMDVFIFPSLYEGLGMALIEAQAAGKKCFVSDTVPEEAIVTENICKLSLSLTPQQWCNAILNNEFPYEKNRLSLKDYDKTNTNYVLKKMYLGH